MRITSTLAGLTGLFISISPVLAQVEPAWAVTYDGESVQPDQTDLDRVVAMAVDRLGRVHVTGESYGTNGTPNIVTIQYSATGQPLWIASYDAARDSDYPGALVLDESGNVYITGVSYGSQTGADLIALKYDSSGNLLWASRYNGLANISDTGNAIRVDSAGNVYVTGYSYNSLGDSDIVTIKCDPQGAELWVARYDGPGHGEDRGQDLVVDTSGNVYVTGFTTVECYFEPNGDEICLLDGITIKYSPSGQELWVDRFDGAAHLSDTFRAIALDPAGHPIVTGVSRLSADLARRLVVTIKFGPEGQRLWVAREPEIGPIFGGGWGVATDSAGNVFVVGLTMQTIKYSPQGHLLWATTFQDRVADSIAVDGLGNAYVSGTTIMGDGPDFADAVIVKYDPCGNTPWSFLYQAGPDSYETANALALDTAGNVYAGGETRTNIAANADFFTLKLTQTDAPLPPIVTIRATRAVTTEGHGWLSQPAVFTVAREGDTNAPLTVHYAIGGTASNGVDYASIPGNVVIPAGRHSAFITIRPIDDTRPERAETVRLELVPDAAYRLCTRRYATIFILDNDRWLFALPHKQ